MAAFTLGMFVRAAGIGVWELLLIFGVLLVVAAGIIAIIFIAMKLSQRE